MIRICQIWGIIILGFMTLSPAFSQKSSSRLMAKTVNWGISAGFNAKTSTHFEVYKGEEELSKKSYTNEVGFLGKAFLRINLSNFFMQPEAEYTYLKERFSFIEPSESGSLNRQIDASYQLLTIPVLAGYNIVKEGPFLFNVYLGPNFKYLYTRNFKSGGTSFNDKTPQYSVNGIAGFSVNISRLYFDFRYELNFPDANIDFGDISNAPESLQPISVEKNENLLSFSIGLMF